MAEIIDQNNMFTGDYRVEFPQLVGQERAKDIWFRALKSGRLHHAYLLLGQDGVGKEAAAFELARALLCLSHHHKHKSIPERIPCGTCDSCVQFAKLAHPDLKVLFPLPKPKSTDEESSSSNYSAAQQKQIDEILAQKAVDYYAPMDIAGGQKILIEHIRALRHEFRLTSYTGGWRIVIISQADRLNVQAANAFLKLLEEPPDNVMFILTSSRESKLLQTIISRCQILRFGPVDKETIQQELIERLGVSKEQAVASARLAAGSWRNGVRWSHEDPSLELKKAVDILRSLVKGDPGQIDKLVETWSGAGKSAEFASLLALLSSWLRDVLRYISAPDGNKALADDIALVKFSHFVKDQNIEDALEEIEQARLDIESNVQPALIAHHLFVNLWKILFTHRKKRA